MKTANKVLMAEARTALSGKWGLAIGGFVLVEIVSILISFIPLLGLIVPMIIAGPITLGMALFYLAISRGQQISATQVFDGFNHFGKAVATYFLSILFIFLWTLLLIIPGIIAGIRYSQIFFILAEHPTIGAREAINRSKQMMEGNKWKYFCLGLRFFGWSILAICTLGIGFLWLIPYMMVSYAKFYDDVKHTSHAATAAKVEHTPEAKEDKVEEPESVKEEGK